MSTLLPLLIVEFIFAEAERRADFEHFVQDILAPAVMRLNPEIHMRVRTLYPTKADNDGSYPYIFLMDPVVPGQDYTIFQLLRTVYAPEQAEAYLQIFVESIATPQSSYECVQSGL